MKQLTKIMMILLALLVFGVGQVLAYPITVDNSGYANNIKLTSSETGAPNGDFQVWQNNVLIDGFTTFCVEMNVTFNPGRLYTATIDDGIKNFKNGPVTESLHGGTKYLYWHFVQGELIVNGAGDVGLLQQAIWMLQGDLNPITTNKYYSVAVAEENVSSGHSYNVKVMNLWDGTTAKQSQLISAPVPEPGTLLLLGSGLAGLALYRRRAKK